MTEIDARLSQLREAAEQLRECGHRIDYAVTNVSVVVQQLIAMGYPASLPGASGKLSMHEWSALLISFGRKLSDASDDIEDALRARASFNIEDFEDIDYELRPRRVSIAGGWRLPARETVPEFDFPDRRVTYTLDDFVSERNRPAYDMLLSYREEVNTQQATLNDLIVKRSELNSELGALKDRLRSYDPSIDLNNVPRVMAMQADLDVLNETINATQGNINDLEISIAHIEDNLMRVKPGDGADLSLIKLLERAETSDWIKVNTEDCVNYIVNKVPIPGKIPLDAYMWDDAILKAPEYGIKFGDEPLVGSVIQMEREHSYADDNFGHLMYVEKVENGVVWVTDNDHAEPVRLTDLTDELSGDNMRYIYFPWHTRAL